MTTTERKRILQALRRHGAIYVNAAGHVYAKKFLRFSVAELEHLATIKYLVRRGNGYTKRVNLTTGGCRETGGYGVRQYTDKRKTSVILADNGGAIRFPARESDKVTYSE